MESPDPTLTVEDVKVLAAVLRGLLGGATPTPGALSAERSCTLDAIEAVLARLHTAGAIYLADGIVTAAYPLAGAPTRHGLRIGEATAYANCALDALAVPFLVEETVNIESSCADCGEAITIVMRGARILAARPAASVLFHIARDCCEAGPAVLTRCPHINFFCALDHADQWLAAHPERSGDVLTLPQGVLRAREHFAAVIRVVRGEDVHPARLSRTVSVQR